ncbi:adenine phosphoribosyltransferase [Candidatus Falkowbacteria bacterium RIFOXYD2_FULL_35_9]|uniref:Adenine phosphoribosyltransferase n=1 Tax=Candidatus Falkowbacteria bacterium RIFOXYC2_FULL_36_12 TaxID=1798002 RepID=A0A1F5T083_9BACT|nr:MAG: adenine phosphoribosyltransferase [Candidatus Falkowbacteria bacterium RIFOXYB2_FULL_35_7]OGF32367.1 MAG: adenine phosphoribosyltransferase [Candidatus Falkowbacteria bacterium RIFOXYC2_FULL_36_12]OGF33890.1 MAG: adenine phosphoribosyltransferase [Candidatus Falkowbacteria bacterium RIFOXYA2_FULL_35_8]OGF46481.1 MAG: adenine phosphoribosyltransferase [Candidatus Falkowbacteria bacterium RIFOXYD2_FULL_35_9]
MDLKSKIREVPNWPIEGVNFKDITTLLEDGETFRYVIDKMSEPFKEMKIDKIVVLDARGFLLGTPIAYNFGVGVCLVRKKGKLPYKTIEATYEKEYGPDTVTMHEDTIKPGEKVLIVDDLLATGGTLGAAIELVEKLGGDIVGVSLIIDLPFLGGSGKFEKYNIKVLVPYDSE